MNGILFKPELIKRIVAGEKDVTRRLDHLKEINIEPDKWEFCGLAVNKIQKVKLGDALFINKDFPLEVKAINPRYHVGEVLFIRESWRIINPIGKYLHNPYDFGIEYLSINHEVRWWTDNGNIINYPIDEKTRSPLFLPALFARHFIQITDVRSERLQDITDEEAQREGVFSDPVKWGDCCHVDAFMRIWDIINPDHPFASNPWVFRYAFKYLPDYKYEVIR
ncbi:MAG: hypothetical protein PHG35_03430 [Dehalococcoidales bacterium]|nr:hypothetical protein [Dehalococcoidales bacterium]